jgi:hypothetical protein
MPPRKAAGAKATPVLARSHKRQLSETPATATTTPGSRTSKRLKDSAQKPASVKSTPTKSKYFEEPQSEESSDDNDDGDDVEEDDSGYEDEDASQTEQPLSEESEDDDFDFEDDDRRKKAKRGASKDKAGGGTVVLENGKELWRPGVKTGLGPGKQVFIEKPKPRGDGGIKYVDDRIHPNTMEFLKDLKKNNDREWFKSMCSTIFFLLVILPRNLSYSNLISSSA